MQVRLLTHGQAAQALQAVQTQLTVVLPVGSYTPRCPDVRAVPHVVKHGVRARLYMGQQDAARARTPLPDGPTEVPPAVAGTQVTRVAGFLPRLAVLDRRSLLMPVNGRDYLDGGILGLGSPLAVAVERVVQAAPTVVSTRQPDAAAPELSATEQAVLTKLVCGVKDDTAARDLNMATRTYRRVVATLMERLAADSRFQAGYRAAKLGLL
jgi:hypothetical protein